MKNTPIIYLKVLLLFCGILISSTSSGLVSSYTFTQGAGAYSAISGGTILGDTSNDGNTFTAQSIGFTFFFNGQAYTQFAVNTNGYVVLGTVGMSSVTVLSGGGNNNVISALNFDLAAQAGSVLRYNISGSAPNRTLVVQWTNYREGNNTTGDNLNFQIRLNETTNTIVVRYGVCTTTISAFAQVGLRGNSNLDFNNRFVSDTINTWATSTAGTLNTNPCAINPGFNPVSGQTYTWTPPTPPAVPVLMTFTNITPTSQTVNWLDSSTTETSFLIYQSSDNVVFTLAGSVASTTSASTGTAYSYNSVALNSGATYYYRVYAMANTPSTTFLSGNSATLAGTICGTFDVGPTGDFANIELAIANLITNGLSCSVIIELQSTYVSSADTFPLVIPFLGCTSTKTLTLRPQAGAVNLKIGSDSLRTIDLNGATWLTIDGRAGGTGTTRNLSIIDSLSNGNALRFINDAQNNTIRYVIITGRTRGSTTNGVIQFSTSRTTAGNSNNTISNCEITKSDSLPQVLLYSNTTLGDNSSNTITNNIFHDWFAATGSNYGINLGNNNETWTISNNSFYQTAAQTYSTSTSTHAAINITGGGGGGSSGSGFVISGNFIGGSAPSCGGAAWTMNGTSSPRFNGISLNLGTTSVSSVQGNTIRNISLTTAAAAGGGGASATIFNAINISGGDVNVGTTTPNTIGSGTANNSIQTIASANGAQTNGINSSSGGIVSIFGNTIGGINANDSASFNSTNLFGIVASAGTVSIRNNFIGSNTVANNMVNAASPGTSASQVTGISSSNTDTCTISGNVIKNLSNLYQGTTNASYARGISTSGGSNSVTSNTIELLSNTSPQPGTNGSASVLGISQTSGDAGQIISGNIVRSISNKSGSGNVVVTGIYVNGPATGNNKVEKNRIYGISAPLDTSVANISGIHINGGRSIVSNNMISIGTDTSGTSYTASNSYTGILKTTATSNSFYFNSVRVGGTSVNSRVTNTYAFRRTSSGTDTLINNILTNFRSNSTTGGSHYSISWNNNTGFTSGKNDLFGNGAGYVTGFLDTVPLGSLFSWFSTTGQDSNSVALNPNYISTINLHINNATPSALESKGNTVAGITTDFDGHVRPGPAGSVNGGATAPDIGADEFDGSPITLDMGMFALVRPVSGCHTASDSVTVSIKNFSSQTINFVANPVAVHVSVTGPNPMTFPVVNVNSGTLTAGSTRNVVITTSYNMSALGTYVFNAYAVTSGDILAYNDTLASVSISTTNGITSPSFSSICSGLPVTLTVSGQAAGSAIQWQSSINQSVWVNVGGATSTSVTVSPTANTYYRAQICGILYSNIDTVNVTTVASPGTTGATRCGIGPVTLNATSANQIAWFDSLTGGSLLDTGNVFTTTVSSSRSFYAAANGNISAPKVLATITSGPNNSGGIMFTITAINNLIVTGFDCQADSGTNTWNIYYRPNNFASIPGANTSSNGWIFVDSVGNVTSAGAGVITTIPLNMSLLIPAGKTYSFYVLVTSGPNVIYSVGTGVGNVNTSNADLQVKDGFAGTFFNCTTSPRVFNGRVRYNSSCLSTRIAANVTVTPPPAINATTSLSTICGSDSINLQASSANTNYRYTWTPTTGLLDSTGASVWAQPTASTTYFLNANDSTTGCNAIDSVSIFVYPTPPINVTAQNDSVCDGDTLFLNANVPQSHGFGASNNSNGPTNYPAPYGNNSFGSRHQMLIRSSEMLAAGMVRGYINSLTFSVANLNAGGALTNFTVKIGNTTVTSLTDTFQVSAMTTVYTNASYTPIIGLNTHNFTAPFYWNGSNNILLETCFNNATATENASMRRSNTSFQSCTYYNADTTNNCTRTVGTVGTLRPNIRLGIRNQFLVNWNSSQTISDVTSATPFSVPTVTAGYGVTVTDTISGCITQDFQTFVVDQPPVVDLGPDTAACGSILLDAGNPGDTYLWNDSSTNRTLFVTVAGTYSVIVTHLLSCISYDTVVVSLIPLLSVSLNLPFDTICTGDGTQTLSGGSPANGVYTGPGVSGTNFDPVAAGAGLHAIGYTIIDTSTGCPSTAYNDVLVQVCAGIKPVSNINLVKVFPNPVNKELTIDLSAIKENCSLQILTPESKVVFYRVLPGATTYPLNVDNFAAGIYYLKINTVSSNHVIRFIKQ